MSLFGPKPIGLALGSGAARGLAHIGVLKVFEAAGLQPNVVTGTSMGAVVGAFYAAGHDVDEIERIALTFDMRQLASVGDVALRRGAILSGDKLEDFLRANLPATFAELRLPFGCVATDLTRSCPVEFTSGDLITAVRASMSVPLVFLPVRTNGMLLVDGEITTPVPVDLARRLGGKVVVGVEVCGSGTVHLSEGGNGNGHGRGLVRDLRAAMRGETWRGRGDGPLEVAAAVYETLSRRAASVAIADADVVISPEVHDRASFELLQAPSIIAAGELSAQLAVDDVRRQARRREPVGV